MWTVVNTAPCVLLWKPGNALADKLILIGFCCLSGLERPYTCRRERESLRQEVVNCWSIDCGHICGPLNSSCSTVVLRITREKHPEHWPQ